MENLIWRLEQVVGKLEDFTSRWCIDGIGYLSSGEGLQSASKYEMAYKNSSAGFVDRPAGGFPACWNVAYDQLMSGPLLSYLKMSQRIGDDVLTQASLVEGVFLAQRQYLMAIARQSKTSQPLNMDVLYRAMADKLTQVQEFRDKKRGTAYFNHLSAISESISALGWVTMNADASMYIGAMIDAGQFFSNRILQDFKKDPVHGEWVNAWFETLGQLQSYAGEFHPAGARLNSLKRNEDESSYTTSNAAQQSVATTTIEPSLHPSVSAVLPSPKAIVSDRWSLKKTKSNPETSASQRQDIEDILRQVTDVIQDLKQPMCSPGRDDSDKLPMPEHHPSTTKSDDRQSSKLFFANQRPTGLKLTNEQSEAQQCPLNASTANLDYKNYNAAVHIQSGFNSNCSHPANANQPTAVHQQFQPASKGHAHSGNSESQWHSSKSPSQSGPGSTLYASKQASQYTSSNSTNLPSQMNQSYPSSIPLKQQLLNWKDGFNDVESRLFSMTYDLKRLIQKFVPTTTIIDRSGVSQLTGVQKALDGMRTDVETLLVKTDSLQQMDARQQHNIENLLKLASDMEDKKTDKVDFERATEQDLDFRLNSRVFEWTCDEMTLTVTSLLGRVPRLDEECKSSFHRLVITLGGYISSGEFDSIRKRMTRQFKVIETMLTKMLQQLVNAKLVLDEAAGIRRQLFNCLSWDRPILMASHDHKLDLPVNDCLFPYGSTKPYTTYEKELQRQLAISSGPTGDWQSTRNPNYLRHYHQRFDVEPITVRDPKKNFDCPEKRGAEVGVEMEIVGGRTETGKGFDGDKRGKYKRSGGTKDKGSGVGVGKEKDRGKAAGGRGAKPSSGGVGGVGSISGNDGVPLNVTSLPFNDVTKRAEEGVQLHDMWETLQFQKRLDASTEGVDRATTDEDDCAYEEQERTKFDIHLRMKEFHKKLRMRKDEMCETIERLNQFRRSIYTCMETYSPEMTSHNQTIPGILNAMPPKNGRSAAGGKERSQKNGNFSSQNERDGESDMEFDDDDGSLEGATGGGRRGPNKTDENTYYQKSMIELLNDVYFITKLSQRHVQRVCRIERAILIVGREGIAPEVKNELVSRILPHARLLSINARDTSKSDVQRKLKEVRDLSPVVLFIADVDRLPPELQTLVVKCLEEMLAKRHHAQVVMTTINIGCVTEDIANVCFTRVLRRDVDTQISFTNDLTPGDQIKFPTSLVSSAFHHAIVTGVVDDKSVNVVHHYGPPEGKTLLSKWDASIRSDKLDISKYVRDGTAYKVGYSKDECLPSAEVVKRAEKQVGKVGLNDRKYNVICNNCENFATFVKTGYSYSEQTGSLAIFC